MNNRFLIILAVLVVGFFGFLIFKDKDSSNQSNGNAAEASNHTQGEGKKGVTLVEYGDFQCPSCGVFFPVIQEIKKEFGDDITFQFRHFPLTQIHQNAMAAHRAAEAANKQGKFWEMHDILFSRQNLWQGSNNPAQIMEDYAAELGLNVEQFKTDYQSSEVNSIINADMAAGNNLKVTGTPTFFLNDEKIDTSSVQTAEDFTELIKAAIENQTSSQE